MNRIFVGLGLVAVVGLGGQVLAAAPQADPTPYWAYGFDGPPPPPAAAGAGRGAQGGGATGAGGRGAAGGAAAGAGAAAGGAGRGAAPAGGAAGGGRAPPDATKHTIPGASGSYTQAEANNQFAPADWFPGDHPTMPEIVSHGRQEARIMACGLCHTPNGMGRPENANLTGLPAAYLEQQLLDFKNGKRVTSDRRKSNTATMSNFAKAMTDEEIKQAVAYFAAIKPRPGWVAVKELATVAKSRSAGGIWIAIAGEGAGTEPLGARIMELADNGDETEKFRNPRSGFTAYVPIGSLAKGKALVETGGGGRFTACTVCHGGDLKGLGPIPTIANRSPSYIARQLADMQQGNRTGDWTSLMAPVVAMLTPDDILNISAYLASLKP